MALHLPRATFSRRSRSAAFLGASLAILASAALRAQEAPLPQLVDTTLSAVVYMSTTPGPVSDRSLHRIVLQAYLAADGRALFRRWMGSRDSYSAPTAARWSLDGDRLCLDASTLAFCVRVHAWGPRIAGVGIHPYAMLDGDLERGNTVTTGSRY